MSETQEISAPPPPPRSRIQAGREFASRWGRRLHGHAKIIIPAGIAFGAALSGLLGYYETYKVVREELAPVIAAPARAPAQPSAPVAAPPAPPRLSFVVLPFANRSGDPEQDFFVDGLTDSLTTDLSRLEGSFVISRGSAFTYRGRSVDLRQVGRELGVRYVVEGSVLRSGDRVRVTAQLAEAESGRQLWADSFDGDRRDMLEMVDQATARLGRALGVQAIELESRRVEREQARNPDATDLALRGWAAVNRYIAPENMSAAEAHFRAALALQPQLTSALNGLAWVLAQRIGADMTTNRAGDAREAERLLTPVLTRDPENAFARAVQCWLQRFSDRAREAIANCQRSLQANPNLAATHAIIQGAYRTENNLLQALYHIEMAFQLSPRDPLLPTFYSIRGATFFHMGRYPEAIADFEQTGRIGERSGLWMVYLAATYALVGRQAEAEALAEELHGRSVPVNVARWRARSWAESSNTEFRQSRERLFEGMRRAGIPEE